MKKKKKNNFHCLVILADCTMCGCWLELGILPFFFLKKNRDFNKYLTVFSTGTIRL